MRAKKILLFFITIICSFYVADACFAEYVKGTSASRNESAINIGVDGFKNITARDTLAGDFGILNAVTDPAGIYPVSSPRNYIADHTSEMFIILSVLDKRIEDKRLLQKIKDKLPTLSEDRLRMMASLSERVANDDHRAKRDIAFFLLTTLIVFS